MALLTRQQAAQSWNEPDPGVHFGNLLEALDIYKEIATEYGLNQSVHHNWRFGDPHKKSAAPDRHDYNIKLSAGKEVPPGPIWHTLYRWLVSQTHEFLNFETVYLITDNRDLVGGTIKTMAGLDHWPMVAAWWKERIKYVGPYSECTTVVFVPITSDTGLDRVHPTWAGTYILDACVYLFPTINFALIDSDCVPVTLFEVQELWSSSDCSPVHSEDAGTTDQPPTSPIAPAHKRARSVDTGRATQQYGPPAKLSKSRSVENIESAAVPAPFPGSSDNLVEQVDYGGSEAPSPSTPGQKEPTSTDSSPMAATGNATRATELAPEYQSEQPVKGVIS
jgi:hypothetical protein